MRIRATFVAVLWVLAGVLPAWAQNSPVPVRVAEFGMPFPAMTFENYNPGAGGAGQIDLGLVIGKRPVIFCYWIAGHKVSEDVLVELQDLVGGLGPGNVALYGVAAERPGLPRSVIEGRIRDLKLTIPVLNDEGFRIAQMIQIRSVPSITILDAEGKLRIAHAGSLRQTLEYQMDLEKVIRRAAEGRSVGTYGVMPRYFPVEELVGQECPDFTAPLVGEAEIKSWHGLLEPDKLNVLVFWSVDCGHCRAALPDVNDWLKSNADGINFVSLASAANEAAKIQTTEFCKNQGFTFPTFLDETRAVVDKYKIVSTPTYVVIRGDGVIDSVYTGGTPILPALEAKKQELLGAASGS
jgi:thiol-disulfide isomerase/thioredoxin